MKNILEAKDISKSFNGLKVLNKISIKIEPKTIVSIFGENGSGKTTLLNILSGFIKPSDGEIYFKEKNITKISPFEYAYLGIGRIWQSPRVFSNLSLLDNLLIAARNEPGEKLLNYFIVPHKIIQSEKEIKEKAIKVLDKIGLVNRAKDVAGSLSFGQKKILSIGMLLINDSEIMLLDEPFAGVNIKLVQHISDLLLKLKNLGHTICLIEHNRIVAKELSNKIYNLENGKIYIEENVEFEC